MELKLGEKGFELVHPSGNWLIKKEIGFSPVEMLVASVGTCSAYVYQTILNNSKITHEFQRVMLHYERAEQQATRPLKAVTVTFYVAVPEAMQKRAERGLRLIAGHCPVIQSLAGTVAVTEQVIFV